jgi:sulfite exporter TauE/SafE
VRGVLEAVLGWIFGAITDVAGWCVRFGAAHPFIFAGIVLIVLALRYVIGRASTVLTLKRAR